jgi:hypothetical protein
VARQGSAWIGTAGMGSEIKNMSKPDKIPVCPIHHKKLIEVNKFGILLKCPVCSYQILREANNETGKKY